jgi:hypothetical protein
VLRFFRLADQLIDGFAGKQLAGQGSFPFPERIFLTGYKVLLRGGAGKSGRQRLAVSLQLRQGLARASRSTSKFETEG